MSVNISGRNEFVQRIIMFGLTLSLDAHRRSGKTLQTSEASVSLLSSLTTLSSFTLVTTGSLRSLRAKRTLSHYIASSLSLT